MVTGMTRFAETVGCALIAEGIETENELTALKLLKVEFGQGYYLARPATIAAIASGADKAGGIASPARKPRPRREAA
jgi:EAL domain-containing protein (putative c-di-GMP-specific phosphodiesterase class I)